MLMPSVFGENLFDDSWMDFPFDREFFSKKNPLYGKNAKNMMKTDIRETDGSYELDVDLPGFVFDKFIIWDEPGCERDAFFDEIREWYQIIDRGNRFYEFVPRGYSKATGIQAILDHYHLPLSAAHAVGDSTNDLPMLDYVPHSIAMGNSSPASLFDRVEYVTADVDHDGIEQALRHYGFI